MEIIGIIDDDEDTNRLLETIFKGKWRTKCFTGWKEAEEEFRNEPPDLIFLDISLSGETGIEVLAKIREIPSLKNISVIALTGHGHPDDRKKFLQEGFDEYLGKPFPDIQTVLDLTERVLK